MTATTTPRPRTRVTARLGLVAVIAFGTLFGLAAPGRRPLPSRRMSGGAGTGPPPDVSLTEAAGRIRNAVAATPASPAPGPDTVTALIEQAFPPAARQQAVAVAWCESRLEPGVVGARNADGTRDWGLFQLNDGGTLQHLGGTPAQALDAEWNILAARRLYDEEGFEPWTCRDQPRP